MALIKCKECEKEISSDAVNCPSCGAPVKPIKKKGSFAVCSLYICVVRIAHTLTPFTASTKKNGTRILVTTKENGFACFHFSCFFVCFFRFN